mgnify:FL=1
MLEDKTTENENCCTPQRGKEKSSQVHQQQKTGTGHEDMVLLDGGEFLLGTNYHFGLSQDGEKPTVQARVSPFAIDRFVVTNGQYAAFVEEAGYSTDAEQIGWSFVFAGLLPDDFEDTRGVQATPWWRQVYGACWDFPEGPQSSIEERMDHPAIHISWNDAVAYAHWVGGRLPTEAEWEYAAQGGLENPIFPWGNELEPDGRHLMNVWQGSFPDKNLETDGWYGTAPVGSYPPNQYGIGEMTGNVWEWCSDWFSIDQKRGGEDPKGPAYGESKVIKGGSYLCHDSYCNRYRIAARSSTTINSSMGHLGFRTVRDIEN